LWLILPFSHQVGKVLLQHPTTALAPSSRPAAAVANNVNSSSSSSSHQVNAPTTATATTTTSSSSGSTSQQVNLTKPRWLVGKDTFDLAGPETSQAIYSALAGDRFPAVTALLGQPSEVNVATATATAVDHTSATATAVNPASATATAVDPASATASSGGGTSSSSSNSSCAALAAAGLTALTDWPEVFRVVQAWEAWGQHGAWVQEQQPGFGPGIKERFAMAAAITEEEWREQDAKRSL
jgi:hypothetical protein